MKNIFIIVVLVLMFLILIFFMVVCVWRIFLLLFCDCKIVFFKGVILLMRIFLIGIGDFFIFLIFLEVEGWKVVIIVVVEFV